MKRNQYLKLICGIMILAAVTASAWSMKKSVTRDQDISSGLHPITPFSPRSADPVLVRRLDSVIRTLDVNLPSLTIKGNVLIHDPKDSSMTEKTLPFVFAKDGGDFYYRCGSDESVNAGGRFVSVNRINKTVFTDKQKQLSGMSLISSDQMNAMINESGFNLSFKQDGQLATYTLSSDNNPACRLYQISFDIEKKRVSEIYTVIPDAARLTDRQADRSVKIHLELVASASSLAQYPGVADVIDKYGQLRPEFKSFKLVRF